MMPARDGQQLGLDACDRGYSTAVAVVIQPPGPYVFGMYFSRRVTLSERWSSLTRTSTFGRPDVAADAAAVNPPDKTSPMISRSTDAGTTINFFIAIPPSPLATLR